MQFFLIPVMVILILLTYSSSTAGYRSEEFKDMNLRISAIHYPPFFIITPEKDRNDTYSGFCYDIIHLITRLSALKMTIIPLNPLDIAKYGTSQATVNQLVLSKEIDVIPMVMLPSVERALVMDFTIPLLIGKNRLMLRYPEEESRLTVIVRPFSWKVWCCLAITIVILIGTMVIVNLYHNHWNLQSNIITTVYYIPKLVSMNTFLILSIIIGQDLDFFFPQRLRSFFRPSIGLLCLVTVVICNAYTGNLTSFMTVPKLKPIVHSLEELAASYQYKLTAEKNTPFTNELMKATSGYLKTLGDSLRQNPHLLFLNNNQATEYVLKYDAVFMRSSVDVLTRVSNDIKMTNGQCRLTASEQMGKVDFFSFPVSKGHPIKPIINRRLEQLWESGLLDHWLKLYTPNVDKCLTANNRPRVEQNKLQPLKLIEVSSVFLILVVGLSASLLVFLLEFIVSMKSKQNI